MKIMTLIISVVILSVSSMSWAGGDAVFGLNWGMSPEEVKSSGTILVLKNKSGNLYIYRAESLPKNIKDARYYTLVFNNNKDLVKIIMVGENITNDFSGDKGKIRFEKISTALAGKYKVIKSITEVGIRTYNEDDEFYQCLAYKGCGLWITMFSGGNKNIILQLNGLEKGKGFIDIRAEAVPEWYEAIGKRPPAIIVDSSEAL